jgi:hypothetical protein
MASDKPMRHFVKLPDGRIGLIVANDSCGGVYRGHYDLWFGEVKNGIPVVEQLCGRDDWQVIERPIGRSPSDDKGQGEKE